MGSRRHGRFKLLLFQLTILERRVDRMKTVQENAIHFGSVVGLQFDASQLFRTGSIRFTTAASELKWQKWLTQKIVTDNDNK